MSSALLFCWYYFFCCTCIQSSYRLGWKDRPFTRLDLVSNLVSILLPL